MKQKNFSQTKSKEMLFLWLLWSYYETMINRLFWIFWNKRIFLCDFGTSTTRQRETSHLLIVFDISKSLDLSVIKNIFHCSEIGKFLLYESLLVSRKMRYNAKRKKVKRRNNTFLLRVMAPFLRTYAFWKGVMTPFNFFSLHNLILIGFLTFVVWFF